MKKFSFQQQVLAGFATTLIFIFALAGVSYLSIRNRIINLQEANGWVYHTQHVQDDINSIQNHLRDAETNLQSYIITNNREFVKPYNLAITNVQIEFGRLEKLLGKETTMDSLSIYNTNYLTEMQRVKSAFDLGGFEAAKSIIETNAVAKAKADVVRYLGVVKEARYVFLTAKINAAGNADGSDRTLMVVLSGSAIILCLVLVLLLYILRTFQQQKQTEDNVRTINLKLEEVSEQNQIKNWFLTGTSTMDSAMRGVQDIKDLAQNIIQELAIYTGAQLGAIYLVSERRLHLSGSYAFESPANVKQTIQIGEGLVGQAARDKKRLIFYDVPDNYVKVRSAIGESTPKSILVQPLIHENELKGVIELAYLSDLNEMKIQFITTVMDNIAIALETSEARTKLQQLFHKTQQQAEELESQQEELKTTNEELVRKTEALQASEEELHVQQEELRQINFELEEKAALLEERNKAVVQAREAITNKAQELEQISKYKSEFLANMSHELRTPLNSILILARILKENKTDNLTAEQIKYASVIHNAGSDLLTLINDILDLSKIESGKLELSIETVKIQEIQYDLDLLFREVAVNKRISYNISVDDNVPRNIVTDRLRLEQILKNLLSNAFKFTPEKGSVSVSISRSQLDQEFQHERLKEAGHAVIAFTVKDTGIGIPQDKQKAIFEAFQQADGSTSRKYGGTGLGLSISRELSNILGGQIGISSEPGSGSSFTLYIPETYVGEGAIPLTESPAPAEVVTVEDISIPENTPAANVQPVKLPKKKNGKHVLLIVEDDENFASVLSDYAFERGFDPLVAYQGDTGLEMALKHHPDAIILDIMLPVMDGWQVLKKLKDNALTHDIPVHMMSAGDERPMEARLNGAIGFLKKPVVKEKLDEAFDLLIKTNSFELNKVLIIEDHEIQSENLRKQLIESGIEVKQAFDGAQALSVLEEDEQFDCIILDLNLPDISGLDLLDKIKDNPGVAHIPVVINTAMELTQENVSRVMKHTHAMVLKNNKSNDRLLDEVNLFMNKIQEEDGIRPAMRQNSPGGSLKKAATLEKALKDKSVLIVDDDMRNVFAITSVLQPYNLKIDIANDGREALKKLDEKPDTDIVLMDIMMPEMDGYEAMREIRLQKRFAKLPILALTAKAMKADREKCIEAGANDYISKPVDVDKLLSLMRVWVS
ncbi:response regulator [Hufsiella ginkgonis]|uniref:histidine kinase n=1 Tax=Hufsiella ginkgonis TaxID=2695274 RepID=A0A7K1XVT6_9SPHI|nr:response regulator [Hufsiella ginkgonis]MXV15094.1 response regulator [Hufsiella ginkgonis]